MFNRLTFRQLIFSILAILLIVEVVGGTFDYFKLRKKRLQAAQPVFSGDSVTYKQITYMIEKPENTIRILVLGGSAAEGFGQSAVNSWWYKIQENLNAKMKPPYRAEVINLAQGAATSADDYARLAREGLLLHPDFVIVYHGWNDLEGMIGNPGWTASNARITMAQSGALTGADAFWQGVKRRLFLARKWADLCEDLEVSISGLYAAIRAARAGVEEKLGANHGFPTGIIAREFALNSEGRAGILRFDNILAERAINANYIPYYTRFRERFAEGYRVYYQRHLHALIRLLEQRHLPAIFVFQPDLLFEAGRRTLSAEEEHVSRKLLGKDAEAWKVIVHELYPEGLRIMKAETQRSGFPMVDMNELVEHYPGELFYSDNVHYTVQGNQWVADELFPFLLQTSLKKYLMPAAA